ncbi:spore coat protein [Jeotgalibacillus campisalis]|uniref:Spore coat protein X/V domain-containing protein n=1 Tax=Jeotgalibacillus campisalis TaxID=220754 RepID=A0A0C2R037_9BACL|nr:spore coat protein [Jeotgalibacillus campisalis]KIL43680.1 hypothetical protein KR50_32000 [Jeotgalibacillus campisalis]
MEKEKYTSKPSNTIDVSQSEYQGLYIRDSHNVDVTQTEVQGLLLVQASLQAAIEAAIVILGSGENSGDLKKLEKIAQSLDVSQYQAQTVAIVDSDGITVRQTEVQIDVVVQAAIQLLAQLMLKLG